MNDAAPTLIAQCKDLDSNMQRVSAKGTHASLIQKLEAIQTHLEDHLKRSNHLDSTLKTLRETKVVAEDEINLDSHNKKLQKSVATIRTRLTGDPETIFEGNDWNNLNTIHAPSITNCLEDQLLEKWKSHIKAEIPGVSQFLLLKEFCGKEIDALENLANEGSRLASQLPTNKDPIERLAEIRTQMNRLINNLELSDVPESIHNLLKECSSYRGFPMNHLTVEMLEWLKDRKFDQRLTIRPAKS